jgi:UDP-GlcNAc:undecaprenyl-phosphate GlcNAc-1-phosphate transferase
LHFLALFVGSALLSTLATRFLRDRALRHGWAQKPRLARDLQSPSMPRLGGVALVAACIPMIGVAIAWHDIPQSSLTRLAWLSGAALLIFLLGLYDDFFGATPTLKFGVQAVAAALLYAGGLGVRVVPLLFGYRDLASVVSLGLTVLWVLWITNAFNLIDGVDGLAAGSALFSALVVFVASLFSGMPMAAALAIVLAGAILGFLRYNFNPATIFLGDCGSLFIGFFLAALALAGAQKGTTLVAVGIPIVAFGLPILDTSLSVVRRALSGKPLFHADTAHIHHRLLSRGMSQRQVAYVLYGVTCLLGLLSLLLLYPSGSSVGVVLLVVGAGIVIGVQHLGYPELIELRRVAQRAFDQKRVIINNLAVRRGTEELARARTLAAVQRSLEDTFRHNDFDAFELRAAATAFAPEPLFSWSRQHGHGFRRDQAWQLRLALSGPGGERAGELVLYRAYSEGPLYLDINLVTHDFAEVLGHALACSLSAASTASESSAAVAAGAD